VNKSQPYRINAIADEILQAYRLRIQKSVPGFLEGLYVYGSVALNDYNPRSSDIDFVAISAQRANPQQFQRLAGVHRQIQKAFPGAKLSGIYVCWKDLGKSRMQISPFPYCKHNRMRKPGFFELDDMTWWQLKHKSIPIIGEPGPNLDFKISDQALKKAVTLNMKNYWNPWIERHSRIWSYRNWSLSCFPGLVEWGTLSVSRQFYALSTGDITSKTNGANYCLEQLPEKYHAFLKDVIRIRQHRNHVFSFNRRRSKAAIEYMSFVMSECERRDLFKY